MKYILFLILLFSSYPVMAEMNPKSDSVSQLTANSEKAESDKKTEETSEPIISTWKFYFIMLIFPIMLIMIFLMVSRGKKG